MTKRCRIRQLGIQVGEMTPGPLNAITDVTDVLVGHCTLIAGEGPLRPGFGPVRTGVTVILPHGGNLFDEKVCAAVHTINGFGKACGFEQVRELGQIEAPVALTNTLNVGLVLDALVQYAIQRNPEIGVHAPTVNIVVGETNDGYLNDIQGRHVHAEHVWAAIANASEGVVQEGAVGAGTGTRCLGWKGGIGTASRVLPTRFSGYTLGALVQSNFGERRDLMINGVPVGKYLKLPAAGQVASADPGSIMIVLATDAPLDAHSLQRLCVRAAAGLARTGGRYSHGSGDFALAFSTARYIAHSHETALEPTTAPNSIPAGTLVVQPPVNEGQLMDGLFRAVVESVEEAVLNSLSCADMMAGRDGHIAYGLPLDQVDEMVKGSEAVFARWDEAH